jgi:hypothetical protein
LNIENIYTVEVYNRNNFPYYGSVVLIKVPGNVTASILDTLDYSGYDATLVQTVAKSRFYFVKNAIKKDSFYYAALIIPTIQPNSSENITVSIKSPSVGNVPIKVSLGPPILDSSALVTNGLGVRSALADCESDIVSKCNDGLNDIFESLIADQLLDPRSTLVKSCKDALKKTPCLVVKNAKNDTKKKVDMAFVGKSFAKCASQIIQLGDGFASQTFALVEKYTDNIDLILDEIDLLEYCDAVQQTLLDPNYNKRLALQQRHADNTRSATTDVSVVRSIDPNLKVGLKGINALNAINNEQILPFSIYFENADSATAPASEVVVVDTLDKTKFDISTFEFTEYAFGNVVFKINSKNKGFTQDINLRPSKNIILRIVGNLDTLNGIASWRFISLDPTVMNLTKDVLQGFLPPNKTKPEGEGHVSYSIKLKPNLPHLTTLRSKADIYFDANDPIVTPSWTNTIDKIAPVSKIISASKTIKDTNQIIALKWSGSDTHAGVKEYTIFVSEDGGKFQPTLFTQRSDTATFKGKIGKEYCFYSIAQDNVGNKEVKNTKDACGLSTPILENNFSDKAWLGQNYPNPFDNTTTIDFYINETAKRARLDILNIDGSIAKTLFDKPLQMGIHAINLNTTSMASGLFFYRLQVDGITYIKKMSVVK